MPDEHVLPHLVTGSSEIALPLPPLLRDALTAALDAAGRPAMVDVSGQAVTAREARATCRVRFPADVARQLKRNGLRSAKGGIVDTAIIAGTMAVKRTHELIPFCHPLPIDGIRFAIDWRGEREPEILCTVNVIHRTGVEMEALTGATVAAQRIMRAAA